MSDRRKKVKRSKVSSEDSDSSSTNSSRTSSSDEEADVKNLKPIKEYLVDRKELASQLFKSVKAEKIRMMLPQILKKVDLNDLEELCANELIGMSKIRIMSIINGQEMDQSSNTDDSDDQEPALEIISDTEWISSEETSKKTVTLKKKNIKKPKKQSAIQQKQKPEVKLKSKEKGKSNINVKSELKEKEKQKEGESILDLLELEMRARAIRALIRKEEDMSNPKSVQISDSTSTVSSGSRTNDKNIKERQQNLKEQLEKIDGLMAQGDDEDVFVVIQPAPTIELLSSESDTEDHSKRINQKLVNERKTKSEKNQEQSNKNKSKDVNKEYDRNNENKNINVEKNTNLGKDKSENFKERENKIENLNLLKNVSKINVNNRVKNLNEIQKEMDLEDGEIIDDNDNDKQASEGNKVTSESLFKRKKIKKNPYIRSRKKTKEKSAETLDLNKVELSERHSSISDNEKKITKPEKKVAKEFKEIDESLKIKKNTENTLYLKEPESNITSKVELYDDKLDMDEVINLDDYPDDMDDLEKNEVETKKNVNTNVNSIDKNTNKDKYSNVPSTETWATRYYRQDDVQNVIKESKIQSEIRKRLRERQRQSKMNNPPKTKPQEILQQSSETIMLKPTGSVEEYFALKGCPSEVNNSTIGTFSKLLNRNDSIVNCKDSNVTKNNFNEGKIKQTIEFINNKAVEQVLIVKKPKLVSDVPMNIDTVVNDDIDMINLSEVKCNDSLVDNNGTFFEHGNNQYSVKNFVGSVNEQLEETELCSLKSFGDPLRGNEPSQKCNPNSDNTLVKTNRNILIDNKQQTNDQKISEQGNKILSESKTSELRPD